METNENKKGKELKKKTNESKKDVKIVNQTDVNAQKEGKKTAGGRRCDYEIMCHPNGE